MTYDAAVITAVYDDYDTLKPVRPQVGLRIDWVCVTDDPDLKEDGWRMVVRPRPGIHPNRAAKVPKMHPQLFTSAQSSVWLDASFRVISPVFVAEALAYADPLAQFVHPWRNCVYEEAEISGLMPKYAKEPVRSQAREYRRMGHPEHWGMWATGVIARRHTADVEKLGLRWSSEIAIWSFQDQISQPYVLNMSGIRPTAFPGTHFANEWVTYEGSGRHG